MRSVFLAFAILVVGAPMIPPAKAATNVALCLQLAENFNQCQREAQWQSRHDQRWGGGGWGGHGGVYGGGGYGGGYGGGGYGGGGYGGGGYGGWDNDYDDERHWRQQRRANRSQAKQAECARWLVALQQNGCAPR